MLTRRQFAVSAAGAAALAQPLAAAAAPGSARRGAEADAFRAFAEQTHPRGREAAADADWRARWDRLTTTADSLSDGAYFVGLRRALGWFNDGHSTVLPFEFVGGVPEALKSGPYGLGLPFRVKMFADGAYVVAANGGALPLLGQRIEQIGAMPVNALIRAHADQWPGNKAWAHRWAGAALSSVAELQALGAFADYSQQVILSAASASVSVRAAASVGQLAELKRKPSARDGWAKAAGSGNYVRPLPEYRAVYLSIDDMGDVEGVTFEQLTLQAFAAIDRPEVERVIIDLRRNGGGNNFWGEPLRKMLGASRFNRPGGLYILTGPVTFSAAQNLATRLERETFALFVGEPTGGGPNHYGDAQILRGAVTGISAMVSTIPWFDSYPQDKREWIMPDLPVADRFADWESGRDPALDMAIAHRTDAAADFLNRDRVFFYSRDSQKAEWKPFWL